MSLTNVPRAQKRSRLSIPVVSLVFLGLVALGIFAKNGWLSSKNPSENGVGRLTNPVPESGRSDRNATTSPTSGATPQLSKEYIYSGSRLLAVEDANAETAPPADLAVWRGTSGQWWVLGGDNSQQVTGSWGVQGDEPVEGDYDGDGKTDFAVYRATTTTWYIVHSSTGVTSQYPFGAAGDIPAQADYDADGKTDSALYRPSSGRWYISRSSSSSGQIISPQFGIATDKVAPADHDGDGRADIAVWRASEMKFYSIDSLNGAIREIPLNHPGTVPVSADYDGDGKADYAVFNSATGSWHIRRSTDGVLVTTGWGIGTDTPVPNDYDGDAKCDIAVWRGVDSGYDDVGNWYISQSASGTPRQVKWGIGGDIPVPAYYRRR